MSKYKLAQSVINVIDTLKNEELRDAVKDFINYTPIDFGVLSSGGYRTAEEQNVLYKKGVSQLDGYKYKSRHQSGLAVDIVPWVNGKYTWDENACLYLAGAFKTYCNMKGINIINGADWDGDGDLSNNTFIDPCHFELE